jgi:hypothetical protein
VGKTTVYNHKEIAVKEMKFRKFAFDSFSFPVLKNKVKLKGRDL